MDRRAALSAMSVCLLASPSLAQQPNRVYRVVWISAGGSPADERSYEEKMQAKWRALGWTYGRNLQYDVKRFRGDPAVLERLATEIAAAKYDVILAGDMTVVAALFKAGVKEPIVVQIGLQLVEYGLVASLARPGGQLTGLQWEQSAEVVGKYPELAKEMIPGLKKYGWLSDSTFPAALRYQPPLEAATRTLGLTLVHVDVTKLEDLEPAFAKLAAEGVQVFGAVASSFQYLHMEQIKAMAVRYKMAELWPVRIAVEGGALASYGPDIEGMYVQALGHADRILRGAKPGDLPIELPTTYELVLNMKRAKALGLTVPRSVRIRADTVIE